MRKWEKNDELYKQYLNEKHDAIFKYYNNSVPKGNTLSDDVKENINFSILSTDYEIISRSSNGYIKIKNKDNYSFIDKDGNILLRLIILWQWMYLI